MNIQSAQLCDLNKDKIKANGVVYTPQEVADEITRFVAKSLPAHRLRILEPSCGDGAFVKSINDIFPDAALDALDIDPEAIRKCQAFSKGSSFECVDFFRSARERPQACYDLIIGNPPYIRSSNFSAEFKEHLNLLARELGFPRTQLRNTWPAFILACEPLLATEGTLAFVVPYELINVRYAQFLIDWLLEQFKRIDVFVPDEKAFCKIDQDAVLLVASKKTAAVGGLHLNKVTSLAKLIPTRTSKVPAKAADRNSTEMKSFLLDSDQLELLRKIRGSIGKVGDVCTSAPGTVTAANSFFILSQEDVERLELENYAKPIIQKSNYIHHGPRFSETDFEMLKQTGKPCFLLDFDVDTPEMLSKKAWDYIALGESLDLDSRYKCRHRTPWYRVPIVRSTDGFFFKRSHLLPKICSNSAGVLTTDTAYQIKMKEGHDIDNLCMSFYNSVTLLFSEIDGRFYGGGVLELTPNEFKGLPMHMVNCTPTQKDDFENSFDQNSGDQNKLFRLADSFVRNHLGLEDSQWVRLQAARRTIRDHRLRHGSKLSRGHARTG